MTFYSNDHLTGATPASVSSPRAFHAAADVPTSSSPVFAHVHDHGPRTTPH